MDHCVGDYSAAEPQRNLTAICSKDGSVQVLRLQCVLVSFDAINITTIAHQLSQQWRQTPHLVTPVGQGGTGRLELLFGMTLSKIILWAV